MAEAKAQKARKVLIEVVSSYDSCMVRRSAIDNSEEFVEFLKKNPSSGNLDSLDQMDIITEIEQRLEISITDGTYGSWRELFDQILFLLNEE